jgi:hypothetical protein
MIKQMAVAALVLASGVSFSESRSDVVCSYAPSQSKPVAALAAASGGAAAATAAVAQAVGLVVVSHSSGAAILTGSGGYVAGTLGTAITGPVIVVVGLAIGGTALTVELVCAPKNHPRQVAQVKAAAGDFLKRSGQVMSAAKETAIPKVQSASASVKAIVGDVFQYAYRRVP